MRILADITILGILVLTMVILDQLADIADTRPAVSCSTDTECEAICLTDEECAAFRINES
jgi:hypothetical protein